MKIAVLTLFLISVSVSLCLAETIYFKNGEKIEAEIIERTNKYIKVNFHGTVLTCWLGEIDHIEEREKKADLGTSVNSEKTPTQIFEEVASAIVIITAQLSSGSSQGSGFIVDKEGVVVTNFHVVGGAKKIEIKLKDGRTYPVSGIIEYNLARDVCVLKIDAHNLTVISLGDSNDLKPGHKVLTIGAPLGLEYSISDGLYSGIREISGLKSMQFTAPISPGNSGGPLLDTQGKAIGVTTFVRGEGQNLNFAIPINEVKSLIRSYPKMSVEEFSSNISNAYSLYQSGTEALYAGNLDTAINYLKQAITVDQSFALAHDMLGNAYGKKGMLEEAIVEAKQAIALNPNLACSHSTLGTAYIQKGMPDEAIVELKQAIALWANDPSFVISGVYLNLGVAYAYKGMLDEGIDATKQALSYDDADFVRAHTSLGGYYIMKGMINEGILELKQAIAIDPNFAIAHNNLAEAYRQARQYDLAIKHCDRAIELGSEVAPELLDLLKPYRK